MKRRTRKQWYQYHLSRSQDAACAPVYARFADDIRKVEDAESEAWRALDRANREESFWSEIASLFGYITSYRRNHIISALDDIRTIERARLDLISRRDAELREARTAGEKAYQDSKELRRAEAEARAARVVAIKAERRVRYLERSPAIRSAAKFFRKLLLREALTERDFILCYYCRCEIAPADSHLEHKRPVSRGGGNHRSNLVLSCSACNLKKGRKTHEEFIKIIQSNNK